MIVGRTHHWTDTVIGGRDRIGDFVGTGVNTILGFFRAIMRKDAPLPSDIGGTFTVGTDSQEAQSEAIAAVTGGAGSELLTVTMLDSLGAAVQGASIFAHGAGGALLGRGTTNASGVVVLNPGTGVIVVTGYYPGYVIPSTSATMSEGVNQTAALTATAASTPAAADPAECTIYATLRNLDGTPRVGVAGTVNVARLPELVSGSYFVSQAISATSGGDGVISWTVPRGATVVVEVPSTLNRRLTVPAQASLDLAA